MPGIGQQRDPDGWIAFGFCMVVLMLTAWLFWPWPMR